MIVTFGIIVILGIITYQDIRYRKIYWVFFPILSLLWAYINVVDNGLIPTFINTALNLLLVVLQFSLLIFLLHISGNGIRENIEKMIGWGDFLFIICLCFGFPFDDFIFIMISGLLFSLLIWLLYSLIKRNQSKEIPLCGLMALFVCFILISGLIGIPLFFDPIYYLPTL